MRHIRRVCSSIVSGFISPSSSEDLSIQESCIYVNQVMEKKLTNSKQINKRKKKYRNLTTCRLLLSTIKHMY